MRTFVVKVVNHSILYKVIRIHKNANQFYINWILCYNYGMSVVKLKPLNLECSDARKHPHSY